MKFFRLSSLEVLGLLAVLGAMTLLSVALPRVLPSQSALWQGLVITALLIATAWGFIAGRQSKRLRRELERRGQALAISEERHRLLLEQASDAIMVADADTGTIIEANRRACELLGWSEAELIGQRHTMMHPAAERTAMRQAFADHAARGGIAEANVVVGNRAGELIPVHARASLITTGTRRYLQAILRDSRPRLRAEEELRRSQARIRELFERVPVSILEQDFSAVGQWLEQLRASGVSDFKGYLLAQPKVLAEQFRRIRITGANPAALRAVGATDLEGYQKNNVLEPTVDVLRAFQLELEALWEGRSAVVSEVSFLRRDGSLGHSVMHWSVPEIDGRLDLARVAVVFSDLSQLRAIEARLREVEDRWELAVRGLNVGIFEKNYVTGETFFSDRWKSMLGFEPHELPNRKEEWQERIHPGDRHRVLLQLQSHLRGENEFYRVEYRLLCKDGSYKWIQSRGRAVFSADGNPLRFIGAHTDISESKAGEAALRASEARFRDLFERSPVAILEEDLSAVGNWLEQQKIRTADDIQAKVTADAGWLYEGYQKLRLRSANRAALAYLEASSLEELVVRKYKNPLPGILEAFQRELESILENRDEITLDIDFTDTQGQPRNQTLRWTALRREDGTLDLTRMLVVLIDFTEIKNAQAAIKHAEERWQLAVRGTQDGIWEFNFITQEVYFSDRWKEMLGYAPDEIPNTYEEWSSRIHPDDLERVLSASRAHTMLRETDFYRVEFRMRCKDGRYKWILSRGQAQFDAQGNATRSLGSHSDVTERMLSEAALRESELRYRRLFEDTPSPMWVYDAETFEFLAVNSAAVRHYGYTVEEFLGMTVFDVRPIEDHPNLRASAQRPRAASVGVGIWPHRRKDGAIRFMRVTSHVHDFAERKAVLVLLDDVTERQEAEERLRASEARYRALLEGAVEGVYETTADGHFISVNPALARMLGYDDPKHMLAVTRTAEQDFYAEAPRRAEFFAQLGHRDSVAGFESEVRCADGSVRWVSENVRAIRDEQARIIQLHGFVSDITERKRAENVIRASEERYRVLFEHSPVAVVECDFRKIVAWLLQLRADGVVDLEDYFQAHPKELAEAICKVAIVGMNEETVRMVRASSKQELMENLPRVLSGDKNDARRAAFLAIWAGRNEIEGELGLHALDGTLRHIFYRWWLPYLGGQDSFEWTQMVMVDLTETRSTEAALAAERERLRVTLRAMAEGLLTTDTEGIIQFMNEAAERFTGWVAGAAVGRMVEEICVLQHEKTRASVTVPVATAILEHRVIEFPLQTTLSRRQGATFLVDGRCAPMHDLEGRAIGAVVVFRDVTERSRLESELLRSSKLESVGILAGGIAHDFNNILTVVMGNVTLAMLDTQVMAAAGQWLTEAELGVMRARDLTHQLLTFAKGGEPIRKAVQLPEVVREAASFALHGSKARCDFMIATDLWPADVDKGQIAQVVQNLVINAVQAMPEGGIIRIAMGNDRITTESARPLAIGSYLRLSITDSGLGIRADHLPRIFDPYFTTKQSGSGLGLATVYSIVRRHQGHIDVESEIGRGTSFHIWLPAAPNVKPVAVEVDTKIPVLSGRVLFMDDEDTIRAVAEMLLKRIGLEVVTVVDGAKAIEAFQDAREARRPFDLVIMDLTVPGGMGGNDAMQALLKIDPAVKAIVSSGYSSDPVLSNYKAHGFRGMVPKPYKFTDLARTIRTVMAGKEESSIRKN